MEKITDFGEHIPGAAKEKRAAWLHKASLYVGEQIAREPFAKTFPEPNWTGLLADGMDPWLVSFARALRDSIDTKPKRLHHLAMWARTVESIRNITIDMFSGKIEKETCQSILDRPSNAGLKQKIDCKIELYEMTGHSRSLKDITIGKVGKNYEDGVRLPETRFLWNAYTGSARSMALIASEPSRDALLHALAEKFRADPDAQAETRKKGTKFDLYWKSKYRTGPAMIAKKVGTRVIEIKGFENMTDAKAYLKEHQDAVEDLWERMKTVPAERRGENRDRVGPDHREGRNVSPDMFMETFGFRGVQFGNYVEGPRRQEDLNDCYDAFIDLAEILGVEPRALSLNGELGMAFGARGTGGINAAKAHYEPGHVVINLTKNKGAGSLAHEWWHGLANAVSRWMGDRMGDASAQRKRGNPEHEPAAEALFNVIKAIGATQLPMRSSLLDRTRSAPYFSLALEMTARSFETWVIDRLEANGRSNDYLANIVDEQVFAAESALLGRDGDQYPYPKGDEIQIVGRAFDAVFAVPDLFPLAEVKALPTPVPAIAAATDPEAAEVARIADIPAPLDGTDPRDIDVNDISWV